MVCPSERVLVRAGSPCRIPRTWPDEAGIGWRQPIERHQPTRISIKQRGTTDWRQLTKRWTSLVQYEPARTGVTALTDAHRRQPMDCCHLASTGVNPLTGTGWSAPMSTSVKRCGPAPTGGTASSDTCWHEPTKRPQMASTSGTASQRTGSCRAPERQSTGGWQAPEHQSTGDWRAPAHRRTRAPAHQRAGAPTSAAAPADSVLTTPLTRARLTRFPVVASSSYHLGVSWGATPPRRVVPDAPAPGPARSGFATRDE